MSPTFGTLSVSAGRTAPMRLARPSHPIAPQNTPAGRLGCHASTAQLGGGAGEACSGTPICSLHPLPSWCPCAEKKPAAKPHPVMNLKVQNSTPCQFSTYPHFSPWQKPPTRTRDASTSQPLHRDFPHAPCPTTHHPWPHSHPPFRIRGLPKTSSTTPTGAVFHVINVVFKAPRGFLEGLI